MEAEVSQTQSVDTFYRVLAWVHANQKRLIIGVAALAAVGLIAGFISWHKDQNASEANAKLFELPVASSPNVAIIPPAPNAFLDLASQYPGTSAGEYALLFGAESLFVNGNYTEAQQQFSKFTDEHPESPLVAQAKVGIAACAEAEGKTSEAIQKYQAVVSTYSSELNVSEPAKLTMARLYEQDNRPDQALNFYMELARSQNPYDPWAAEARERGELLLAKHPELRKVETAPPATSGAIPIPPSANSSATPAPATIPAPASKPSSPALNLLNFPPAATNAAGKK